MSGSIEVSAAQQSCGTRDTSLRITLDTSTTSVDIAIGRIYAQQRQTNQEGNFENTVIGCRDVSRSRSVGVRGYADEQPNTIPGAHGYIGGQYGATRNYGFRGQLGS